MAKKHWTQTPRGKRIMAENARKRNEMRKEDKEVDFTGGERGKYADRLDDSKMYTFTILNQQSGAKSEIRDIPGEVTNVMLSAALSYLLGNKTMNLRRP